MGITVSANVGLPRKVVIRQEIAVVERRPGLLPFALCLLFAMPLVAGLLSVSSGLRLSNRASHFARDVASMYQQGMDFSRPENQGIVFDLAHAQGLPIRPDNAVVIVTKVRKVADDDCDACANRGLPVVERQIVLGNGSLHPSTLGVMRTAGALEWRNDPAARVKDYGGDLRPGEVVWAAETWFATSEQPSGIYVRAIN